MFGWRKKNEGFDWHSYVRTTIKVRREARKERIDAARQAALDKAHQAGEALAAGGKAAGAAALKGAQVGAVQSAHGLTWFAHNLAHTFVVAFGPLGAGIAQGLSRLAAALKGWDFAGPAALIGCVALLSGAYRAATVGLNAETWVPLGLGLLLLAAAAPALLARIGAAPTLPALDRRAWYAAAGMAVIGAGALTMGKFGGAGSLGSLANVSVPGSSKAVEGRAIVLSGDTLRLQGQVYRLAGIEAPDRDQACMQPKKRRWKCGERAMAALEAATRGAIACTPSGSVDAQGRIPARCSSGGQDIAAGLVRQGHVFAERSLFGGYSAVETEARERKAGIWNGEAERPSEYRARLWEAAKKSSPEGCPIKGTTVSGVKVFLQPWDSGYRRASVRANRGERWFCSDDDAVAAGFRAAARG